MEGGRDKWFPQGYVLAMETWIRRGLPVLFLFVAACGSTTLDSPEFLPRTLYANGAQQMTFVMASCSDTCSSYEVSECSVELDKESSELNVDISVTVSDREGTNRSTLEGCGVTCGPAVYAHCPLPALSAGKYRVIAGSFETSIEIQ